MNVPEPQDFDQENDGGQDQGWEYKDEQDQARQRSNQIYSTFSFSRPVILYATVSNPLH